MSGTTTCFFTRVLWRARLTWTQPDVTCWGVRRGPRRGVLRQRGASAYSGLFLGYWAASAAVAVAAVRRFLAARDVFNNFLGRIFRHPGAGACDYEELRGVEGVSRVGLGFSGARNSMEKSVLAQSQNLGREAQKFTSFPISFRFQLQTL